jgi:hypothetical protein
MKSKAQWRWMFAAEDRHELPKGTAERWARHTKSIRDLPEHVKRKKKSADETERDAFAAAFVLRCAELGITDPGTVAKRAEDTLSNLLGNVAGKAALLPLLGSVGLPIVGGFGVGGLAAKARNQMDTDDAESLRLSAQANAYRRRAAVAAAHAQVRKLIAADPKSYVAMG